jgi:AAA domain-containing protein
MYCQAQEIGLSWQSEGKTESRISTSPSLVSKRAKGYTFSDDMPRPYFNHSVQDLEMIFQDRINDREVLLALKEELGHRNKPRAVRLRDRVSERLAEMNRGMSDRRPPHQEPSSQAVSKKEQEGQSSTKSYPPNLEARLVRAARIGIPPPAKTETHSSPPITNQPLNILSAWTSLEVLSPQIYIRPEDLAGGDRRRVVALGESSLPWEQGERSRPNQRLYFQVVLGSIKMEPAIGQLIERYGDSREEKPSARGKAALATVVVDRQGLLVESPAIGISSFGWGVMAALTGELADLAQWPDVELRLIERIEKVLLSGFTRTEDEEGQRPCPLTKAKLVAAYETLVQELGLPGEWVEPPEFAIRSYTYFKDPNPPEPLLINSFFLADLAFARKLFSDGIAPRCIRHYLGVERPLNRRDLLCDMTTLAEAISPGFTPPSRWPSEGRFPLVLLQQAAVNLAFRETKVGGILGVNGPPGTGKTTLLRDLVAGVVTERAEAMAKFDDPETAFESSGQRIRAGNSWLHLYRLNSTLRGFEMVVASTNNKAVENVSAELPGINAIARDAPNLRYFKTLSDGLHQSDTWGAIAAVLGNAQNRSRFKQAFWWDDDNGLNNYLWAVAGSMRQVEIADQETGQVERRTPHIVEAEQPPANREEALNRWGSARKRFLGALDKSRQLQTWLESLRVDLAGLPVLAQSEASTEAKRNAALECVRRLKGVQGHQQLQDAAQELHRHDLAKPGFLAQWLLFWTSTVRKWSELRRALVEWQTSESAWQAASSKHQQTRQRLLDAQQKHGVILGDQEFFQLEHGKLHQSTPWFPPAEQRLRDEVFVSAMALHRAFIDTAAKPLRHNLGALMNVFTTQTFRDADKQALLPDLWTSLFLVVPLVSTTCASVNRMLGKLPPESLGWLFVDEAGQALPQAAVGALLRTRRAIVVGDPIQIEPVVVLPDTLTHAICLRFGVDSDCYTAPSASVQTLADASSAYVSEFQTHVGSRSVGVPLLVHRRCSDPMFSISNAIAYSDLMVQAKVPKPSKIRDVLGPSKWIHVAGNGEDKWCGEEGNEVLRLLDQMKQAGVKPDIYIITPFVIVEERLRKAVRESGILSGWIDEDDWRWTNERIGTVHTAQGREAEAVILVLGAPHPTQTGARGWAGRKPNLLNVAVTRAKEAVYVIGNRQLWRSAGLFSELDKRLPS